MRCPISIVIPHFRGYNMKHIPVAQYTEVAAMRASPPGDE
jgi:hypothetical protein